MERDVGVREAYILGSAHDLDICHGIYLRFLLELKCLVLVVGDDWFEETSLREGQFAANIIPVFGSRVVRGPHRGGLLSRNEKRPACPGDWGHGDERGSALHGRKGSC